MDPPTYPFEETSFMDGPQAVISFSAWNKSRDPRANS